MPALTALAAAAALAGCASTGNVPLVENGYAPGRLALAAIERQDWATAERLLTAGSEAERQDPARLINLGRVYMATGRSGEAVTAWRTALASPYHHEVQTWDGRNMRTDLLAREALDRYATRLQVATR